MEEQSEMTLYYNEISQPSRAVKTLLMIGNIPHKDVLLNIFKGENRTEEFLKINPRGQVPYISQGDFVLTESNAILKYICNSYLSLPETWYPKDIQKRAEVDKYLEWWQYNFREGMIWRVRFAVGIVKGIEVNENLENYFDMA